MRFVAPPRAAVDPVVFDRPPLTRWSEFATLLRRPEWPDLAALNDFTRRAESGVPPRFVAQSPALLADGLHYEQRIAERGEIATRERNWHDLLNALIWLRFPELKAALNSRQVEQIAIAGPKSRTRAQCALTLFDEAGTAIVLRDPALLALWDVHDWHGLFWRERDAWSDGRIEVTVFGHALLEHALKPRQLLVGKALVVTPAPAGDAKRVAVPPGKVRSEAAIAALAQAIVSGALLTDPQELRPLPLSGIPGWHADNANEAFYLSAPCFCPLRAGRRYPPPLSLGRAGTFGRAAAEASALQSVDPAGTRIARAVEAAAFVDAMAAETR
jgi:hypothetical protein